MHLSPTGPLLINKSVLLLFLAHIMSFWICVSLTRAAGMICFCIVGIGKTSCNSEVEEQELKKNKSVPKISLIICWFLKTEILVDTLLFCSQRSQRV